MCVCVYQASRRSIIGILEVSLAGNLYTNWNIFIQFSFLLLHYHGNGLMYERSTTTTCCELVIRDMEKDKKQQLSVSALHSLSSTIRRRDGSVITFCTMEKEDECTLRGIYNTLWVQIFHLTHFIFHISPDNFPFSFITALCSVLLCMMIHILIYYQDAFVQT